MNEEIKKPWETMNPAEKKKWLIAQRKKNLRGQEEIYPELKVLLDPDLRDGLGLEMQLNGIGPIGDGFYGVVLTYTVTEYPDYTIDTNYFTD